MSSGRPRRNAQVDRCFYIYLKIQIPKPTDKQYGSLWSAYCIRLLKWLINNLLHASYLMYRRLFSIINDCLESGS